MKIISNGETPQPVYYNDGSGPAGEIYKGIGEELVFKPKHGVSIGDMREVIKIMQEMKKEMKNQ